jgi:hypothetical protein
VHQEILLHLIKAILLSTVRLLCDANKENGSRSMDVYEWID